jgi:hypothetical protein
MENYSNMLSSNTKTGLYENFLLPSIYTINKELEEVLIQVFLQEIQRK